MLYKQLFLSLQFGGVGTMNIYKRYMQALRQRSIYETD